MACHDLNAASQNVPTPMCFFFVCFVFFPGLDTVKYKPGDQHKILSFSIFSLEISASVLTLKNVLSDKGTVAPHTRKVILIESLFNSYSLGITVFVCRERRQ